MRRDSGPSRLTTLRPDARPPRSNRSSATSPCAGVSGVNPSAASRSVMPRSAAAPTSFHGPQLMLRPGSSAVPPLVRQRVEDGIGRGMVRLTRRTQHGRNGREQHEKVERIDAGQSIEQVGAVGLRREHRREPLGVLLDQSGVVEHAGAVHDASQRRTIASYSRDQLRPAPASSPTSSASVDDIVPCARNSSSTGSPLASCRAGRGAPGGRRPVRPAIAPREPESRQATRDQVRAIATNGHVGRRGRGGRRSCRRGWPVAMKRNAHSASSSGNTWRGSGESAPGADLSHEPLEHAADQLRDRASRFRPSRRRGSGGRVRARSPTPDP